MGSFVRLADAVNFMTPPGTHQDLSCNYHSPGFFFVWIVHLMAVHKTVTPPLGS